MKEDTFANLSRRERQIMDIVYKSGSCTAASIMENLPEPPGYSAVRALLRILETKGYLIHKNSGIKYIFYPTISPEIAKKKALEHVVDTFFESSPLKVMEELILSNKKSFSKNEIKRISDIISKSE